MDETTQTTDIGVLLYIFAGAAGKEYTLKESIPCKTYFDAKYTRTSEFLQEDVFKKYHTETELMRYITRLGRKDVSLAQSMISLGSCTMKLNPASTMLPLSRPEFMPHASILINLFKEEKPQICLMGATVIGRDLGPRVSSALTSGLTADCTSLEIGSHEDKKVGKTYENLLYQIRPAFGGNIVATIVNPEHRPQMATVREGVMKKEICDENYKGEVVKHDVAKYVPGTDFVVKVIDRHVEKAKHNLKGAAIVVAGGYGMGSKEGFDKLFELAKELHVP